MGHRTCLESHHGVEQDAEGECPYCARPKHIDTGDQQSCAMCGMVITHPDEAASVDAGSGVTLYFCCIWCLRVYWREATGEVKHLRT